MKWLAKWLPLIGFRGSRAYWEGRYALGGDSGTGSGGNEAKRKAEVINQFVRNNKVGSVIEFGCGDGRQLALADYPEYTGLDVSAHAVGLCRSRFTGERDKQFMLLDDYKGETADLSLSLDVIYHLVEDSVYLSHLQAVFAAGGRFVGVYTTSCPQPKRSLPHVKHRDVERDIARWFPDFSPVEVESHTANKKIGSDSDDVPRFLFYRR